MVLWSLTITTRTPVKYSPPLDIKITKAILEPNCNSEDTFLLYVKYTEPVNEKELNVPICVLRAPVDSSNMELVLDEDEELTFSVKSTGSGEGTIHLSGYFVLLDGDDDIPEIDMEDLEDDEEEEEVKQPPPKQPQNKNTSPPKNNQLRNANQGKNNQPPRNNTNPKKKQK